MSRIDVFTLADGGHSASGEQNAESVLEIHQPFLADRLAKFVDAIRSLGVSNEHQLAGEEVVELDGVRAEPKTQTAGPDLPQLLKPEGELALGSVEAVRPPSAP